MCVCVRLGVIGQDPIQKCANSFVTPPMRFEIKKEICRSDFYLEATTTKQSDIDHNLTVEQHIKVGGQVAAMIGSTNLIMSVRPAQWIRPSCHPTQERRQDSSDGFKWPSTVDQDSFLSDIVSERKEENRLGGETREAIPASLWQTYSTMGV